MRRVEYYRRKAARLREQRRPRRIGTEARRRLLQLVSAGDVDRVEIRARPELAEEHQHTAVRREGRAFIVEARSEHALARTVRLENADRELAARLPRERDVIAARRPHRSRVPAFAERDALRLAATRRHHVDLRGAAAIALEADVLAVGRIARRGIDRRRVGQPRRLLRAQVHREQVGIAALLQAHDHALAVRREARRKRQAREVADNLALTRLDVEQVNARPLLPVRHVGDFLRRRIEARRQNEIVAARDVARIGAVLIHDGEALDAMRLRTGLVDEDDATVEITLLAGQALVDRIGDDVADAAPVVLRGEVLLAVELLPGEHVPQAEFRFEAAIALAGDTSGDQRLRVDGAPVGKARHRVRIGDLLDEGRRVARREQARALELAGDDLRAAARDVD